MPDGETKVVFVELPARLAWDAKADAATNGVTLREWYRQAAEDKLRQGREERDDGIAP